MERIVQPELLDELPPADPRALRSRDDLVRVNAWMHNSEALVRALRATANPGPGQRVADLGCGDGRFLLRVAQQLHPDWQGTRALLLDRRRAVSAETLRAFVDLGWQTETHEADVLDWLSGPAALGYDVLIANLFLHHFPDARLAGLLRAAARSTHVFIAIEPRRSPPCLFFSHCLWFIGCSPVTRHDAVVSVRAGFNGLELSRLWPVDGEWTLQERPAGRSNHLFIAQRRR
jgi:SAM-dependent methyltransferase